MGGEVLTCQAIIGVVDEVILLKEDNNQLQRLAPVVDRSAAGWLALGRWKTSAVGQGLTVSDIGILSLIEVQRFDVKFFFACRSELPARRSKRRVH